MKFSTAMRFFRICTAVAMIGFGLMRAEAQTGAFTFPAIGTVSNVTAFAVKESNRADLVVWAYRTNGQMFTCFAGSTGGTWTNKYQIDQQVLVKQITNVLYGLCTNTDITIDKSKGALIFPSTWMAAGGNGSQSIFYYYNTIQLVKNPDGSYSVPDLSGFSTELNDSIPIYVPNLQWARVEVGNDGNSIPFEVDDVRLNSASNPIDSDGFLYLATDVITNSASSGGNLWLKLTLFDGAFQIFNGDGNPVPETPMVLALNQTGTNATVTVNGGDSGRGFLLQSSPDLTAWTNCSPVTFISPTNDLPNAVPGRFVYPATNRALFFRTATTNLPPM